MDNETWILERGHEIIEKMSSVGYESLGSEEKLVYCFWVLDYSIRNAGDLETAYDLFPKYLYEGFVNAKQLNLNETINYFGQSKSIVQDSFYERFDVICDEIRSMSA
jgi:hypothetical protein